MDLQLLLLIVLYVSLLIWVVESVVMVVERSNAEREYLRLLPTQANTLLEVYNRVMPDGVVTSEKLEQLIASLDRVSEGLSIGHRRLISAALHQRSLSGRARYAAKVMEKAGIGSGLFLATIP
jgi:hypothetical protein